MICHVAVTVAVHLRSCVLAEVVAVCAHLAFSLVDLMLFFCFFKIEESEGTFATTVTRGTVHGAYLAGGSVIFYGWK